MNETPSTCSVCGTQKVLLLTTLSCPKGCDDFVAKVDSFIDAMKPMNLKLKASDEDLRDQEPLFVAPNQLDLAAMTDSRDQTTLPDGTVLTMADYQAGSLFSTLEILGSGGSPVYPEWEIFTYGQSQAMPESGNLAHRWHTNVPRSGDSGLPQSWAGMVTGWRATVNIDDPIVRAWANKTVLSFNYNYKNYFTTPLGDFLHKTHEDNETFYPLDGRPGVVQEALKRIGVQTVTLRENLSYKVCIVSDAQATSDLREYLRSVSPCNVNKREAILHLETLSRMTGSTISDELQRVIRRLHTPRVLSLRVHLDGVWKRTIV